MEKARDINDIVEKIKDEISLQKKGKIYDNDVATHLRMTPFALAARKAKKNIPYKEILDFCYRTGIDPIQIFYKET